MYSCREEVSESTTKHFLPRCAYTSSAWGVWLGDIEGPASLSCDDWETLRYCLIRELDDSRSDCTVCNYSVAKRRMLHSLWTFSCCPACDSLFHLDMGSCVERSSQHCKVIPNSLEPLHLLWMKSALHPSSGPPTDASCSCTLLPVCTQTLLSEDVATAKLGHRQNLNGTALNGAILVGWQKFPVSMVLFLVPPVNLNISAVSCSQPGWWSYKHKKANPGSSCFDFGSALFVLLFYIVRGRSCHSIVLTSQHSSGWHLR